MQSSSPKTKDSYFVISLDFELYWGMFDVMAQSEFARHVPATREAVPRLLRLLNRYQMHATWATVGFLFFADKKSLSASIPDQTPSYKNLKLCPYKHLDQVGNSESEDPLHFAASLLPLIKETPGQEIASHTFSHYYNFAAGQTALQFNSDIKAAVDVARSQGIEIRSIVFPRNQCRDDYLRYCAEHNILCYRGNPQGWLWKSQPGRVQKTFMRLGRYVDAFTNVFGKQSAMVSSSGKLPINIPASRFLRPYRSALTEPLKIRRIKAELDHAAQKRHIYHLWWHPHNFSEHLVENLETLEEILLHASELRISHNLQSLNMGEVALKTLQDQSSHLI